MTPGEKRAYHERLRALGVAKLHSSSDVATNGEWLCRCGSCSLVRGELPKAAATLGGYKTDLIAVDEGPAPEEAKKKQPKKPLTDNDLERVLRQHFEKLCRSPREKQVARVTYLKTKAMLSKGWVRTSSWKHYYQELEKLEAME